MREHTRFELCDTHGSLWLHASRYRMAEIFCEGGPGCGGPCGPVLCKVWPGSDLFAASATDDVAAEWVRSWSVNNKEVLR